MTISNGLQWNRAGDTVLYADTPTGRIDAFDFDPASGAFTGRRAFAEIAGGGDPQQGGGGWLWSLSGLKTLVETGASMDEPAA